MLTVGFLPLFATRLLQTGSRSARQRDSRSFTLTPQQHRCHDTAGNASRPYGSSIDLADGWVGIRVDTVRVGRRACRYGAPWLIVNVWPAMVTVPIRAGPAL